MPTSPLPSSSSRMTKLVTNSCSNWTGVEKVDLSWSAFNIKGLTIDIYCDHL